MVGERALLVYPAGLDFIIAFFGCLQAGVVAVPASLPRPNRPAPRLRAIVADARPRAVLTTSAHDADSKVWQSLVPELDGVPVLFTDSASEHGADSWQDAAPGLDTFAFRQYTSGSTAASKGVMVSHGNLLHNSRLIERSFRSHGESRGVFWLPLHHDMGLIGGVLQTLYCGGFSTLLSPVTLPQKPACWLEAIYAHRHAQRSAAGRTAAYDWCVRKITEEQRRAA